MEWIVIGVIVVLVAFFWLTKKPAAQAAAVVTAGKGEVTVDLKGEENVTAVVALILCYAAKIQWLTQSESSGVKDTFRKVYGMMAEGWPRIPDVEMVAMHSQQESKYSISVHFDHKVGWFVSNHLPVDIRHRRDIATHYFFLLRELSCTIDPSQGILLGDCLRTFQKALFNPQAAQSGLSGLRALFHEANTLLQQQWMNGNQSAPVGPDSETKEIARWVAAEYDRLKQAAPNLPDAEISQKLLALRYADAIDELRELARENKPYVESLPLLCRCILNMEAEGGRDPEKLELLCSECLSFLQDSMPATASVADAVTPEVVKNMIEEMIREGALSAKQEQVTRFALTEHLLKQGTYSTYGDIGNIREFIRGMIENAQKQRT
jgi:hypothetical protein